MNRKFTLKSKIDLATIDAYRSTHYKVSEGKKFTLHVGVTSVELSKIYIENDVRSAAFITAFNPYSQIVSDEENLQRSANLENKIKNHGLSYLQGMGQHPGGNWPGEFSFLIFGLSLEAAKKWGMQHKQNAIIWCDENAIPHLILLR